jgi:hypothetical protein
MGARLRTGASCSSPSPARGSADWSLPSNGWHFDFELHRNADSLGGLFVFTFFSRVEERAAAR